MARETKPTRGRASAERTVRSFEALARAQARIKDPLKRDRRKLGQSLVKALYSAGSIGDEALVGRAVLAAWPLLSQAPLFAAEDIALLKVLDDKKDNLNRCKRRCKRRFAPGTARQICRANCYAYYFFCEL